MPGPIRLPPGRDPRRGGDRTSVPVPPPPSGDWYPQDYIQPEIAATAERRISVSGTILDQTVPAVYGTCTVRGLIGSWEYQSASRGLGLGIVFAFGEQDSITTGNTYINGEVITSAVGVYNESVHAGDGSTALSTKLTNHPGWVAADTTHWKNYAHAVVGIDCKGTNVPSNFVFTSKLGGRKVAPIGGGTKAASSNPARIGYDILTSSDWAGLAATRINEASWEAFEDWCDDVMSDASKRYEFNGAITERDPMTALRLVLGHALARPYVGTDGKIHVWYEGAPSAITGDWSASASATITEDAAGGAATTEVSAGDYLYVGTNLRQVSSVTDDDTIVLDSAVTVSGVKVRPLSQVYVKTHHWVSPPAAKESNLLQTPDEYRVRFEDEDNAGSHEVLVEYDGGGDRVIESQLPGCTTASVATRIAETTLKVAHLQPFFWSGIVGNEIGAALEPGDVLLFDDDVLTMQPARVLPPIQARPDGTYALQLREYDPNAYSEATETTDTLPSIGNGWSTGNGPVVRTIQASYSSTLYDVIGMNSSTGRVELGDTSRDTQLTSSTIRLPNDVPIYGLKTGGSTVQMLKMDTSDRLVLGDGSEPVYINSSSTGVSLNDDAYLTANWTSKRKLIGYNSTSSRVVCGASANGLELAGGSILFNTSGYDCRFMGYFNGTAAAPTTSELPSSADFCLWQETDTNTWAWYVNDGGTIRQIS